MSHPNTERGERVAEIRERHEQWKQKNPDRVTEWGVGSVDYLLSLYDSQAVVETPLCPVHKSLDERDDLELQIGNNCVACSLIERSQILDVLEPLANPDGTQDSLTVLNNALESAATRMRDHCIETVKEYWQRIQGEDDEGMRELLFGALVVELENLTLEGQEKSK